MEIIINVAQMKLTILFIFCSFTVICQFDNTYEQIKSSGAIPIEFRSFIEDNFNEQIDRKVIETDSKVDKKAKSEFLLGSNWFLQRILSSGKVLFGDSITSYVNEVGQTFKDAFPGLKIKIFVLKSTRVNAFATDQGLIFVTTGLLARLENEAQLAFILGHELSHVEKSHSINEYVQNQKIINAKVNNSYDAYDNALKAMSSYSKAQEMEADELGVKLYLSRTIYEPDELINVFDILTYSYLPFGNEKFNYDLLSSGNFAVPDSVRLKKYRAIEANEGEENAYSSHPNILSRKRRIDELIEAKHSGKKRFIVSEQRFEYMKQTCRFETIRLNLLEGRYERAIYHALYLQNEFPNNYFLKSALAKGFYGLFKLKVFFENNKEKDKLNYAFGNIETVQGVEHQLVNFLSNLKPKDLGAYSLNFFLSTHKESNFSDNYITDVLIDLLKNEPNYEARLNSILSGTSTNITETSKDTIQKAFWLDLDLHILAKHGESKVFKDLFTESKKRYRGDLERKTKEREFLSKKRKKKKYEKWQEKYRNYANLDSLITVMPYYFKTSERKGENYIGSEKMQLGYTNIIRKATANAGIKNTILNPVIFDSSMVASYNDLAVINESLTESFRATRLNMIPIAIDNTSYIKSKYGTTQIYFSGVINNILQKDLMTSISYVTFGIVVLPLFPFALFSVLNPSHDTVLFNFVVDIESGKIAFSEVDYFEKQIDSPIFLESQINYKLQKMKKRPKKASPLKN